VQSIVTAQASFEGAGFPVNRPFPQPGAELGATDPFLMLDEMGPIEYGPGEAKGAPDHPHRGFETVTYLFDGEMEHRDSTGGGGLLRGGDTQWMTAGAGLVHSETPTPAMLRDGGLMHGIQLWVNLPRTDKLAMPRYQDLTGDRLTLLRTADERALVRLVAGELDGHRGPGSTYTPIVYAHATIKPGGRLALAWPDVYNALVYVVRGSVRVADDSRPINAQQLAVLGREGDTVVVEADEESDVLLLGGRPLREPIAWYGPFVMNTKQEIIDAVDDFEAGRMGSIAPEHA
jgi:redox-sensitive bicupin YhaK (pirin superfamily)